MHGLYWYLAIDEDVVRWLHISVLELLATGFSTIIFTPSLPPDPDVRLTQGADASATATTLTRQTERSDMLALTHAAQNSAYSCTSRFSSLGFCACIFLFASNSSAVRSSTSVFHALQTRRALAMSAGVQHAWRTLRGSAGSFAMIVRKRGGRAVMTVSSLLRPAVRKRASPSSFVDCTTGSIKRAAQGRPRT